MAFVRGKEMNDQEKQALSLIRDVRGDVAYYVASFKNEQHVSLNVERIKIWAAQLDKATKLLKEPATPDGIRTFIATLFDDDSEPDL